MIPYLLIFLVPFLPAIATNSSRPSKWGFALMMLLLVTFAGFRDMIGGFDVYIYGEVYELTNEFILGYEPQEYGMRLLFVFLGYFSKDRYFMFFVFAFLLVVGHSYQVKKLSPMVYLSVFILFCKFYLMSFVYLRQGLAMLLVWFSIPFLLRKKLLIPLIFQFLAFYIHKSSIVFAPFLFLHSFKFTIDKILIINFLVLIFSFSPLGTSIIGIAADTLNEDRFLSYGEKSGGINYFYLFEGFSILVLVFITYSKFYQTAKGTLIVNGLLFYTVIMALSLKNATFIRMGWYYLIFYIVGITYFVYFQKEGAGRLLSKSVIMLYFGLMFFRLLFLYDGGDFMPYKAFFQDFDRGGMWDWMEYRTD